MDVLQQKNFDVFIRKSTMYLLDLTDDRIYSRKAKETFDDADYLRYREHVKHLRKFLFPSPNKNENLTAHGFAYTIDRLQRLQPLKKIFCCDENIYLVKKSFTEGVQYVKQGEVHIYMAIGRPLDIFISNTPLNPKTFISNYDTCTRPERISPGKTKCISSDTYYVVIAPCHTFFTKKIQNTPKVENSTEMPPLFPIETNRQVSVTEDRNGGSSSEQIYSWDRMNWALQPSGSRDNEPSDSKRCIKFEKLGEFEAAIDNASTGSRNFTENDRPSKRAKSSTPEPNASTSRTEVALVTASPNSLRNEMGNFTENDRPSERAKSSTPEPYASTSQTEVALVPASPKSLRNELELMRNTAHSRAVFAVRKDSSIESYTLRSDSTFRILQDSIITGSFVIENEDMDPSVIEYHGDVQFIRELARFKNGSIFETTLAVEKDLLTKLRESKRKKKEKDVVDYFFDFAFETVEAAYKNFSEMRNTRVIGSCVPAIVPLGDSRFLGAVSDAYEAKP